MYLHSSALPNFVPETKFGQPSSPLVSPPHLSLLPLRRAFPPHPQGYLSPAPLPDWLLGGRLVPSLSIGRSGLRGRFVSRLPIGPPRKQLLQPQSNGHFRSKMAAVRVLRTWSRTAGRLVSRLGRSEVGKEWFVRSHPGEVCYFVLRVLRVQGSRDGEVEGGMQNEGQRRWCPTCLETHSLSLPGRTYVVTWSPSRFICTRSPASLSFSSLLLSTIRVPGIVVGTGETEIYYIH